MIGKRLHLKYGNFKSVIFYQIVVVDPFSTSCAIALWWMARDLIDDVSTLIQVMACSHTKLNIDLGDYQGANGARGIHE